MISKSPQNLRFTCFLDSLIETYVQNPGISEFNVSIFVEEDYNQMISDFLKGFKKKSKDFIHYLLYIRMIISNSIEKKNLVLKYIKNDTITTWYIVSRFYISLFNNNEDLNQKEVLYSELSNIPSFR